MIYYIFLRNPRAFGLKGVKRVDMNIFTVAIIAYTCSSTTTTTCVLVQKMRARLLVVTSLLKIKLNIKISSKMHCGKRIGRRALLHHL